jgi:hypothetical protein
MANRKQTTEYKAARQQLLAHNPACHWCGDVATEADHLIEHDAGGSDSIDNLVPSCKPCNSRRGQMYRAKRDALRQQTREKAFFTETHITPHPSFSVFGGNQPELAGTGENEPDQVPVASEFPRLVTPLVGGQSYGPLVAAWAQRHLNIELMPWQVTALSGQLVHDETGD